MSDITMCDGKGCKLKDKCYRHTAKKDEYQLYFTESPIENGKCEYFWETKSLSPEQLEGLDY